MGDNINEPDYYAHLRNILDATVLAISVLYEKGERNREFADACRRVSRSVKLLKAARQVSGEEDFDG